MPPIQPLPANRIFPEDLWCVVGGAVLTDPSAVVHVEQPVTRCRRVGDNLPFVAEFDELAEHLIVWGAPLDRQSSPLSVQALLFESVAADTTRVVEPGCRVCRVAPHLPGGMVGAVGVLHQQDGHVPNRRLRRPRLNSALSM